MAEYNPMDGIYLINKPPGISSFQVVKRMRQLTGVKKVGHAGTLDPFAEGLLIVAVGRNFTRQIDSFQALEKTYVFQMIFGKTTDTLDSYGKITESNTTPIVDIEGLVSETIPNFIGTINQVPPSFSAKKIEGRRAYALAREGMPVEPDPIEVVIHDLALTNTSDEYQSATLAARTSKGTYVRSLARDIAKQIDSLAYINDLARTAIGPYHVETAMSYNKLSANTLSQARLEKQVHANTA